ncbi:MAG: sigma-70 family RNA polymerase sigma factor [Myxococcales bacterium]|nr:sigma-70 family RNA polymerase sigma factor [Myxococcales bacterium]MCB9704952.1 sigma-70 family RNA polymerase sigma factor [Myxococcales bacterium]
MVDDRQLLAAWRAGDLRAGEALFDRHIVAIHRFFKNKLGDSDAIEDLVQRTFMACVEGRDRFREDASFRSYLFGIAHNLLCDHFRERARGRRAVDVDELSAVDLGAGALTVIGQRREIRLLLEALRRIPLRFQVVLELTYWEEMSSTEIAAVLGLPAATARSRIRRARELLGESIAALAGSAELRESTTANLDRWAQELREGWLGPARGRR